MQFAYSCMESLREPLLEAQLDREADTTQNSPLWNFAAEIMVSTSTCLFYNEKHCSSEKWTPYLFSSPLRPFCQLFRSLCPNYYSTILWKGKKIWPLRRETTAIQLNQGLVWLTCSLSSLSPWKCSRQSIGRLHKDLKAPQNVTSLLALLIAEESTEVYWPCNKKVVGSNSRTSSGTNEVPLRKLLFLHTAPQAPSWWQPTSCTTLMDHFTICDIGPSNQQNQ